MADQDDMEMALASWMSEVLELRLAASIPSSSAVHPQVVLDSLLDVRAKADRVEELSIKVMRLRSNTARKVAAVKAQVEDIWAQKVVDIRKASARQGDQYVGPRERYAEADLATLVERRQLRKAEDLLALIDEASDVIRVAFRGLNEILQDHRTWLKTIQTQSYFEK